MKFKQIPPALAERLRRDGGDGLRELDGGCVACRIEKRMVRSVSLLFGFALMQGHALNYEWDSNQNILAGGLGINGGTGIWNESNINWQYIQVLGLLNGSWSNSGTNIAIFGAATGTVSLTIPVTVGGLIFNTPDYLIQGDTLTLAGIRTITTNNGNTSISSIVAGSNGMIKAGVGTLTLSGANAHTGGTTVSAGTLIAAHATALGTGTVLINGGSVVSSVTSVSSGTITLNSGALDVAGTSAAGAYTLGTNEDFNMSGGTLEFTLNDISSFDKIQSSGTGSTFSLTGGILDLNNSVASYLTTYQIFSGFNSGSVSGLSIVNYNTADYTANLSNTGLLSFTAVPEPGPWALGGVGALLLLIHRRRSGAVERA